MATALAARFRDLFFGTADLGAIDFVGVKNGQGGPQDYAKALEWYEKAAAAGNADAMVNLGALYANGQGVTQDYAKALDWSSKAEETKSAGAPGAQTAHALSHLAWTALFVKDFSRALAAAERAHQLDPTNLMVEGNHAHALMFLNRTDEARALYLSHRDEPICDCDKRPWRQAALDDFAEFRKAGLTHPLMTEIEAAFARGEK